MSEAQLLVNSIAQCSVEATPSVADTVLNECTKTGFASVQLGQMICMAARAVAKSEGCEASFMNLLTLSGHLQGSGTEFGREAVDEVKALVGAELLALRESQEFGERAQPLLVSTGILEPPAPAPAPVQVPVAAPPADLLDFDSPRKTPVHSAAPTPDVDFLSSADPLKASPAVKEQAAAVTEPAASVPAPEAPAPAKSVDLFDLSFDALAAPATSNLDPFQAPKTEQAPAPASTRFDALDAIPRAPSQRTCSVGEFEDLFDLTKRAK